LTSRIERPAPNTLVDPVMDEAYLLRERIYVPRKPVSHRGETYDPRWIEMLGAMQARHFWYRGRHRFLLHSVNRRIPRSPANPLRVLDLGGGCGGWIRLLAQSKRFSTAELALADSCMEALEFSARHVPDRVKLYHVDLLDLQWSERWDVIFLLDVLEHIPEQDRALRQAHEALAPGGLLFLTTPAIPLFWTWNDDLAGHVRRYTRADYRRLASGCGYKVIDTRYFMFLLSPLLLCARWATRPKEESLRGDRARELMGRMHRVPNVLVNSAMNLAFSMETPLGHIVPFPWGTSVLAVLQKPGCA
jgi:2-polyprenyl-3-methyl-5-hydroxy-6-metoxy-1,4-benzoquinol methylase